MDQTLLIFILVYLVMGVGKLPWFKVDRTGAAVVGSLALIVVGSISPKAAWLAIDYRTIGLLFGLMVVSAAFNVAGFYGWAASKLSELKISNRQLLAVLIIVGAVLSSVLTKDVVAVAMVPLLISLTLARNLNPIPFLLGFCFAVNTGSTATLIGSPQNMITGQVLHISFNDFILVTGLPALLSLPIVWAVISYIYRDQWQLKLAPKLPQSNTAVSNLDNIEIIKASVVLVAVILAFVVSPWPHELIALAAGGVLLISRRESSHDVLGHVDGNLLLLIAGLFVVNAAFASTGLPHNLLSSMQHIGLDLNDPLSLYGIGAVLSNLVGNNPAVMLLVPYIDTAVHGDALAAALVLGTGFSSNIVVFGSLAGIITVEQSARFGLTITSKEFFKAGFLITIMTMIMAGFWIWLLTHY